MSEIKQRDFAVDIVKFFAVFLIINSHADIMYPRMSILATGGAIGDCLFLFVSGYTLFLGKNQIFGSYYKRRIQRIFPSVFAALAFVHLVTNNTTFQANEFTGGEFIVAIMIYYVLLYFIRKYAINHIPKVLGVVTLITLFVYVFWFPYKYEVSSKGIYGITTLFRWIPYFAFMLMGAYMGLKFKANAKIKESAWNNFIIMTLCFVLFYAIQVLSKKYTFIAPYQIVTLIPLMGIVIYFYKWCKSDFLRKIYEHSFWNKIIMLVSGICLESYLIQYSLITDKMNSIWPLNLIFIFFIIIASSYLVRCVARFLSQTFENGDYNWKKIFSIY